MINDIFLNQITKYNPTNIDEIKNSMKEVLQDIILSGFGKTDFFKYAVFYGGTSLRIFRNLPRFSEDLDFTLLEDNPNFSLDNYMIYAKRELDGIGIEFEIYNKKKTTETSVDSQYFKFNLKKLFDITFPKYSNKIINNEFLSIKVEVEKSTFSGGSTEIKLLTYPSFTQVRTFDMETLFASKLIAVLNRKWKTRIKGRDFYDYLFYISNGTKVNIIFLENGLKKLGYLKENEGMTLNRLKEELKKRFENLDFENAKKDVISFAKNDDRFLSTFNKDIFIGTIDLIEISKHS